jgi:hypothetical protein
MKTTTFMMAAVTICSSTAFAQDSLQVQPSQSLPQGQYETPGKESHQKEDRVEVARDQIPPLMKDALDRDGKYTGWENGQIFFEKNSDQYIIHIVKDNTTETFRFDKTGKEITTDKPIDKGELKQ